MRHRQWLVASLCVFVSCAAVARAQTPELEIVAPDSVSVTGSKQFSIWLLNGGAASVSPEFAVAAEDGDGEAVTDVALEPATGEALPAGDVRRYRLRLTGQAADDEASGQLVARADGFAPASIDLTFGPEPVRAGVAPSLLLLVLLVVAGLVVARRAVAAGIGDKSLRATLPDKDWDFSTGFGSTLVAGGGLLTIIVAAGVLPEETQAFSKAEYTALGLVFAAAIVVAGIVYAAFEIEKDGTKHGSVWGFLTAAFVTVWATFGQLVLLGFLVGELTDDEGFSGSADAVLLFLVVLALVALYVYTRRIEWIIKPDEPTRKQTKTRRRKEKVRDAVASLDTVSAEDAETVAVNAIALAEAGTERRGRFPLL
jgi:hypothetical protein